MCFYSFCVFFMLTLLFILHQQENEDGHGHGHGHGMTMDADIILLLNRTSKLSQPYSSRHLNTDLQYNSPEKVHSRARYLRVLTQYKHNLANLKKLLHFEILRNLSLFLNFQNSTFKCKKRHSNCQNLFCQGTWAKILAVPGWKKVRIRCMYCMPFKCTYSTCRKEIWQKI